MPPALGDDLQHFPDVAKLHHATLPVRPDVGGEHLDRGVARLDRLGQRIEMRQGRLAAHQEVQSVIAIAGPVPLAPPRLDRLLQPALRRAINKIEQCRGATEQCRAAHLIGRCAQLALVAAGKRDRHEAVDMRIDATGNDDLAGGVDDPPRGVSRAEAARCADRYDLLVGNRDIDGSGAAGHDCGAAGNDQIEHGVPSRFT